MPGRRDPAGPGSGRRGPAGPGSGRTGPAGPGPGRRGPAGPGSGRRGPAGPGPGRRGPAGPAWPWSSGPGSGGPWPWLWPHGSSAAAVPAAAGLRLELAALGLVDERLDGVGGDGEADADVAASAPSSCRSAICELTPMTWPLGVEQRAAGVAGVDRGVGLDDAGDRRSRRAPGSGAAARETMPVVSVWSRPKGLPIAYAGRRRRPPWSRRA